MEIFKLVGSILVDSSAADQSLSKTDNKAQGVGKTLLNGVGTAAKWGAAVVAAGVAAGAALVKMATDTAATCDEIDKMSQKIGVSREAYQELDYILSQNGMDVNQLQSGMKSLVNTMQSAQEGGAAASAAFDKLEVSATNADGSLRDQEDVFYDVIDALQSMENETERNALANDLFGKSASELTPLLNSGAGSMEELRQKAHDLGLVLDDEVIDSGVELTDTLDTLKRQFSAVATRLGGQLMPIVTEGANFLIDEVVPMLGELLEQSGPMLMECLEALLPPLMELAQALLPVIIDLLNLLLPILTWLLSDVLVPLVTFLSDSLGAVLGWVANTALPWVVDAVNSVVEAFTSLKDSIDEKIEAVKEKVQSFQDKVENAKNKIKGFIDSIKSFFNFSISWPHVPTPHFFVSPAGWNIGQLLQGVIPSLSVQWYAKAMQAGRILDRPTVFGYDEESGQALAGGESGSEAVVGTRTLESLVKNAAAQAVANRNDEVVAVLLDILGAVEELAGMKLYLDRRALVGGLMKDMDTALGRETGRKKRGTV